MGESSPMLMIFLWLELGTLTFEMNILQLLKLAGEEVCISMAVQDLISSCRAELEPESDSRIESVAEAGESHVSCKMNLVVFVGFEWVLHSKLGTHIPCVVEWHR